MPKKPTTPPSTQTTAKPSLPNVYPGEYRFCPAAYYASNAAGLGMYVKYRRSDLKTVRARSQDARHIWLEMPDREVIIVRMTHELPFYPSEGGFSEFVNLNFYQETSARDLGFDYYMTNYADYMGSEHHSPLNRRVRTPGSMTVISDSGGFQFLTGKLDYMDPAALVSWYNQNADVGIVLDMPIASVLRDEDMVKKLALLQRDNTRLMQSMAVPGLEFMNVAHGSSADAKARFHDIVGDTKIQRLAVGGGYFDTVLSSVASVLSLHERIGKHYQHYHFLGITNLFQVVAYMRMVKHGLLPFVTSDSSTYYQKGASKEYLIQSRLVSNISHLNIGQRDNLTSPFSVLPCSCPVCGRLRYTDALSNFGGSAISSATAFHNAWRYNEYIKAMQAVIDMPYPKLAAILEKQLGKRASLKEGLKTIEFVDCVADVGLKKALRKFSYYLSNTGMNEGRTNAVVSLFSATDHTPEDHANHTKRAQFLLDQYRKPRAADARSKPAADKAPKLTAKIMSSKHRGGVKKI